MDYFFVFRRHVILLMRAKHATDARSSSHVLSGSVICSAESEREGESIRADFIHERLLFVALAKAGLSHRKISW